MSTPRHSNLILLGLATLVVAIAITFWLLLRRDFPRVERSGSADPEASSPREPGRDASRERSTSNAADGSPATAFGSAEPEAIPADAPLVTIEGRVVDPVSTPIPYLTIRHASDERTPALGTSDANGTFEIEVPAVDSMLYAHGEGFVTLRPTRIRPGEFDRLHVVVVAPRIDMAGLVIDDEDGAPIANAHLRTEMPRTLFTKIRDPLDATSTRDFRSSSGADGSFLFAGAPTFPGIELAIGATGYEEARITMPATDRDDMEIRLRRRPPDPEPVFLEGIVLAPSAEALRGAQVWVGDRSTESGRDGRFRLDVSDASATDDLVCAARGFRPIRREDFGTVIRDVVASGESLEPIELRFEGEALSIAGVLVDEKDRPQGGFLVRLEDPTVLTPYQVPPDTAEKLSDRSDLPQTITSSKDGSFSLGGLGNRDYRLRFARPNTLEVFVTDPVPAGTEDLRVTLPVLQHNRPIRGRVVTLAGEPVADVRVTPSIYLQRTESGFTSHSGNSVTTNYAGEFEIRRAPRFEGFLSFESRDIISTTRDIPETLSSALLEVVVLRRAYVHVTHPGGAAPASYVAVEDSDGRRLEFSIFQARGSATYSMMPLENGESPVLAVPETATTIVLLEDHDREHSRLALDVEFGTIIDLPY